MLHVLCAMLVLTALLAETKVMRHWTQQHTLVQQAAAGPAPNAASQARN